MTRVRRGMALAVTIGVVSLVAVLAVATLSLAGRMVQASTLGARDARLDAGAAYALAEVSDEWRQRGIGRLAVGATSSFGVTIPGVPVSAQVWVTRVGTEVFWTIAECVAEGGATRRESLVLRRRIPDPPALFAEAASNVTTLGFLVVDSIAASADVTIEGALAEAPPGGVVHVMGDATIPGGSAEGILIVEGHVTIFGAFSYRGVIVARGGITVASPNVSFSGLLRATGTFLPLGSMSAPENEVALQDVMMTLLTPRPVAGRRWGEVH